MSLKAMLWVFEHSEAEGSARLVMLALADTADDNGLTWPYVATIARKARVSERTAQRCLRDLVEAGELTVSAQAGGHTSNRYQLIMSSGDNLTPQEADSGDTDVTSVVTLVSPITVNEHKDTNVGRRKAEKTPLPADWRRSNDPANLAWEDEREIPCTFTAEVTDDFRNYWHAQTGAKALKADWSLTWRVWVGREWNRTPEYRRAEYWRRVTGQVAR